MTFRAVLTSVRDWAALVCAIGMVGFLTFVPQHAPVSGGGDVATSHHRAVTDWPSRTAELSGVASTGLR